MEREWFWSALSSKNKDEQLNAVSALGEYLALKKSQSQVAEWGRIDAAVSKKVFDLVSGLDSKDVHSKMGGVLLMNEIITSKVFLAGSSNASGGRHRGKSAARAASSSSSTTGSDTRIKRFHKYLQMTINSCTASPPSSSSNLTTAGSWASVQLPRGVGSEQLLVLGGLVKSAAERQPDAGDSDSDKAPLKMHRPSVHTIASDDTITTMPSASSCAALMSSDRGITAIAESKPVESHYSPDVSIWLSQPGTTTMTTRARGVWTQASVSSSSASSATSNYEFSKDLVITSCQVLAKLCKLGANSAELIEQCVNHAFELMKKSSKSELMRLAAACIIREVADSTQSLFSTHLKKVISTGSGKIGARSPRRGVESATDCGIWPLVYDKASIEVREMAACALRVCLQLVVKRPATFKPAFMQIYARATDKIGFLTGKLGALAGTGKKGGKFLGASARTKSRSFLPGKGSSSSSVGTPSAYKVHGTLLVLGELLSIPEAREVIGDKYEEICVCVLKFKKHKTLYVKCTVIDFLPLLAAFDVDKWKDCFSQEAMQLLLGHLEKAKSSGGIEQFGIRIKCFDTVGKLSMAIGSAIVSDLQNVMHLIEKTLESGGYPQRTGIAGRISSATSSASTKETEYHAKQIFEAALRCLSCLVAGLNKTLLPLVQPLIDSMFSQQLSRTLVTAMQAICKHLPELEEKIHSILAFELWSILGTSGNSLEKVVEGLNGSYLTERQMKSRTKQNTKFMKERTATLTVEDESKSSRRGSFRRHGASFQWGSRSYSTEGSAHDKHLKHVSVFTTSASSRKRISCEMVLLALSALEDFELNVYYLLPFIRESASTYLDSPIPAIRHQSALTCWVLLTRMLSFMNDIQSTIHMDTYRHLSAIVSDVLERLLTIGIADRDRHIREAIITLLTLQPDFDHHLSQPDMLHSLFIALNDEAFLVRRAVIEVLGRLAQRNPGQVMPHLRKALMQLLTELEFCQDIGIRQESAILLDSLVSSSHELVRPYVSSMLAILLARMKKGHDDLAVQTQMMATAGQLSLIANKSFRPFFHTIVRLLCDDFLKDKFDRRRRLVALTALSQLVESTENVVDPYLRYHGLLDAILESLTSAYDFEVRRVAMKCFGVIGALDPFIDKESRMYSGAAGLTLANLRKAHETRAMKLIRSQKASLEAVRAAAESEWDVAPNINDEDYYPAVAINSLVRMLGDSGLIVFETDVLNAIVKILKLIETDSEEQLRKCIAKHLGKIMPRLLYNMRSLMNTTLSAVSEGASAGVSGAVADDSSAGGGGTAVINMDSEKMIMRQKQLLSAFSSLVRVVENDIGPYLDAVFNIISQYWHMNVYDSQAAAAAAGTSSTSKTVLTSPRGGASARLDSDGGGHHKAIVSHVSSSLGLSSTTFGVQLQLSCLNVIAELAKALGDDFKVYLTDLIPLILGVLYSAAASVSISPYSSRKSSSSSASSPSSPSAKTSEDPSAKAMKRLTRRVLYLLDTIGPCLEDHLFLIVPPLMKLCEGCTPNDEIRMESIKCISQLSKSLSFTAHASRVIHPLIRIADGHSGGSMAIQKEAANALCNLLVEMGSDYALFIPSISRIVRKHKMTSHRSYKALIGRLVFNSDVASFEKIKGGFSDAAASLTGASSYGGGMSVSRSRAKLKKDSLLQIGAESIKNVVQRNDGEVYSKEDWVEWLRSLQIELLRQSPQLCLRECGALAMRYSPLATSLFNNAFLCCWSELDDAIQETIYRSFFDCFRESVFKPGTVPNEVLLTLLNLIEFMDREGVPLPAPCPTSPYNLGLVAEICHSYANALHFKEKYFVENNDYTAAVEAASSKISTTRSMLESTAQFPMGDLVGAGRTTIAQGLAKVPSALRDRGATEFMVLERGKHMSAVAQETVVTITSLMSVYHRLQQYESAVGLVEKALSVAASSLTESSTTTSAMSAISSPHWFEKLDRWDEALDAFERRQLSDTENLEYALGRMRCHKALGNWSRLLHLCQDTRPVDAELSHFAENQHLAEWATLGTVAVLHLGDFAPVASMRKTTTDLDSGKLKLLRSFVDNIPEASSDGAFYRAVLAIKERNYDAAQGFVDNTRAALDSELTALVGESYSRAYDVCVRVQQCVELEEIIAHKKKSDEELARGFVVDSANGRSGISLVSSSKKSSAACRCGGDHLPLKSMWYKRLQGAARRVDVWQSILTTRGLCMDPRDDVETVLKFSSLCRKNGLMNQSLDAIASLLDRDTTFVVRCIKRNDFSTLHQCADLQPHISFTLAKHCWSAGLHSTAMDFEAFIIDKLITSLSPDEDSAVIESSLSTEPVTEHMSDALLTAPLKKKKAEDRAMTATKQLLSRMYVRLGLQKQEIGAAKHKKKLQRQQSGLRMLPTVADTSKDLSMEYESLKEVFDMFEAATRYDELSYWAWHDLGLMHYEVVNSHVDAATVQKHLKPCIEALFKSIALGSAQKLKIQDVLRLLQVWFSHGSGAEVRETLATGFGDVPVATWLDVIPQMIARINDDLSEAAIQQMIEDLLCHVGQHFPQSLVYPLAVASSTSSSAQRILDHMRLHSPTLVSEALLVSSELIRCAILWDEMWFEAIETGSRMYFTDLNQHGFIETVTEAHEIMMKICREGNMSLSEMSFEEHFGAMLRDAMEWCKLYNATKLESHLNMAWHFYAQLFAILKKQRDLNKFVMLQYASPNLYAAKQLTIGVPGLKKVDTVRIDYFADKLKVMESKQRPRRISIFGSDGVKYDYLLKGHEDLRLDERVMQLFALVNTLLTGDESARRMQLRIEDFSVIPLSPSSGILSWIPNTETMNGIIKEYRTGTSTRRCMIANIEAVLMQQLAPDYVDLCMIQKLEAFLHSLKQTSALDLQQMLWLKSASAEKWLERRTTYVRSLAVMSMVGYILGLGDRHPSNLMLDKVTGKLVHIDFGDCFEVTRERDKLPEKFPFRLTRMLTNALETPCGIYGHFLQTSNLVMSILRTHKESVEAVLEAFAHDPLVHWRLDQELAQDSGTALGRAASVLARINSKLNGTDFNDDPNNTDSVSVKEQVSRLIVEAQAYENLCQAYLGWCPLW